jgi:ABC-type multidrug transport system fused ATPase/permease subunit
MILFSVSVYCVCIFFTTCIKTTKTGTTAVKFYNFGSILLGFVIVLPQTSKFTKIVFNFIPQINFYGCLYIIYNLNNFESLTGERIQLKSAKMSFIESIIMYIVDIIFYLGLSIFIQSFRDSGLHFIPYLKSFFSKTVSKIYLPLENENIIQQKFEINHQELSEINKQNKQQNKCLQLINVSKSFGDLKAVDNFNGELFPNEIFCLLGHNGAGKSTTINMISGILDPDNGDILLNGKSLVTNKNYLYQNIGLCQQEDIFFDYLTVEEHLEYMCRIKGSSINKKEIDDLINQIELSPKKNSLCGT